MGGEERANVDRVRRAVGASVAVVRTDSSLHVRIRRLHHVAVDVIKVSRDVVGLGAGGRGRVKAPGVGRRSDPGGLPVRTLIGPVALNDGIWRGRAKDVAVGVVVDQTGTVVGVVGGDLIVGVVSTSKGGVGRASRIVRLGCR